MTPRRGTRPAGRHRFLEATLHKEVAGLKAAIKLQGLVACARTRGDVTLGFRADLTCFADPWTRWFQKVDGESLQKRRSATRWPSGSTWTNAAGPERWTNSSVLSRPTAQRRSVVASVPGLWQSAPRVPPREAVHDTQPTGRKPTGSTRCVQWKLLTWSATAGPRGFSICDRRTRGVDRSQWTNQRLQVRRVQFCWRHHACVKSARNSLDRLVPRSAGHQTMVTRMPALQEAAQFALFSTLATRPSMTFEVGHTFRRILTSESKHDDACEAGGGDLG